MNNYDEIIQKHFKNALNSEEQKLFNSLKETNEEFQVALKAHEDLMIAFQVNEDKEISNLIKDIEGKKKPKPIFLKIAAALVVFITGYYFLFLSSENYESYLEEYPNVHHPITRGNSESKLDEAFNAYESKSYKNAIVKFDAILSEEKSPEIEFYKAMALLNDKQYVKAENILQNLTQNSFEFKDETFWYLTILSLIKEDETNAKKLLITMNKENMEFKQKERKRLLNKLN
ncbi:hypothetical protein [uncultured Tenacibaculum sp.]|uniref:hypothetical protein n=1 Tax=uncultured Tenacibaculum sp. TaxID=174713 RepID=UPI0026375336|nr:hypothetical protein [uncultured Tenacibaculum sp.]